MDPSPIILLIASQNEQSRLRWTGNVPPVGGAAMAALQLHKSINHHKLHLWILIAYQHMGFDQNSFIRERPFFANKISTSAKLSRTPCLSFAGPMLANNTSYEDSFTTCQITPENHGSLLDSLLNMQLTSRNPFSVQIVAD